MSRDRLSGRSLLSSEQTSDGYFVSGAKTIQPQAGSRVSIALMPDSLTGGATGGFCYGLVAVDKSGKPSYTPVKYVAGDDKLARPLEYQVPAGGLDYLWLVVTSAPAQHTLSADAQWYCRFRMEGTRPHADMLNAEELPMPKKPARRRR